MAAKKTNKSEKSKSQIPDTLYHYCSAETFLKIIQNKELWMTNLFYYEDEQEHYWFENILKEEIANCNLAVTDREANAKLLKALSYERFPRTYCACFSRVSDSVSQWKSFASGGTGYAIGFSRDHLNVKRTQWHSMRMVSVEYRETEQRRRAQTFIQYMANNADTELKGIVDRKMRQAVAIYQLGLYCAQCKNPLFRTEEEVRLILDFIYSENDEYRKYRDEIERGFDFRLRGNQIVPFYKLKFVSESTTPPPINEVICGPKGAGHERNIAAIRHLFELNGYKHIPAIHTSRLKLS